MVYHIHNILSNFIQKFARKFFGGLEPFSKERFQENTRPPRPKKQRQAKRCSRNLSFAICVQSATGVLESLLELINTTAHVDKLLLAGEEGVALGANFNSHFASRGGSGRNSFAASATDYALFILGMNSGFHFIIPRFLYSDVL